jgi:predicted phosphodiesterase
MKKENRILCVGDLHLPYCRPNYLQFCKDMYRKHKCNGVVFLGDVVDLHSISFHPKRPDMPNASAEYELAKKAVSQWRKAFPKAVVCIGNHDARPLRLAETVSIPEEMLKSFAEIWDTKHWKWDWEFVIDDVCYIHGTGCGGEHPAYNKMKSTGLSYVMGHTHSAAGIKWLASPKSRMFGMDVSTGIDDRSMAFAYGQFARRRSIVGCGVVLNGVPYYEIMPIGKGERYFDGRK